MGHKYRQALMTGGKYGVVVSAINIVCGIIAVLIMAYTGQSGGATGAKGSIIFEYLFIFIILLIMFAAIVMTNVISGISSTNKTRQELTSLPDAAIVGGLTGVAVAVSSTVLTYIVEILAIIAVMVVMGYTMDQYNAVSGIFGLMSLLGLMYLVEATVCSIFYAASSAVFYGVVAMIGGTIYASVKLNIK